MKIILLNGPAGSGKDTIGQELYRRNAFVVQAKFARPLKEAAAKIYCGGSRSAFDALDAYGVKDQLRDEFLGQSARSVQIALSETYFKPLHGPDVFGKLLARELKDKHETQGVQLAIVTDSGFKPEAEAIVKTFGAENVLLINLCRDGKTFEGDSRSYIQLDGVKTYKVYNPEGKSDEAADFIMKALKGEVPPIEHQAFSDEPDEFMRLAGKIMGISEEQMRSTARTSRMLAAWNEACVTLGVGAEFTQPDVSQENAVSFRRVFPQLCAADPRIGDAEFEMGYANKMLRVKRIA